MEDYNVEDRLITKDDWEEWLNKKDQKEKENVTMKFEGKWHKYPDEKPPKDGLFLITHKFRNQIRVDMAYFTKDMKSETVTAWAEMPEPYKEEEEQ